MLCLNIKNCDFNLCVPRHGMCMHASLSVMVVCGQGFAAYKAGDWEGARCILEQTKWIRQTVLGQPLQDGPSTTLLDYMAHFDYVAPFTWKGYRELTEK